MPTHYIDPSKPAGNTRSRKAAAPGWGYPHVHMDKKYFTDERAYKKYLRELKAWKKATGQGGTRRRRGSRYTRRR